MILVNPEKDNTKVTYKVKYTDTSFHPREFNKVTLITIKGLLLEGEDLFEAIWDVLKEQNSFKDIYINDIEVLAIEDKGDNKAHDIKSMMKDLAMFQMFMSGLKPNDN